MLCGDRDETINHKISECKNLVQRKNKTRHDGTGKGIHWELCKKLKFNHTSKWHMKKIEALQENEMHNILWDFEIQTDHSISARRSDLVILFTNPSARAGYDTRSIFKRSLKSEFSFS